MVKKRNSEYTGLDEIEKTLHTSFCTAANSISHLYTQAQHQQKHAFQAGERHAVSELEGVSGDDPAMSPGTQPHQQQVTVQQHQQQAVAGLAGSVGTSVPVQTEATAATLLDQSKNSVFTGGIASSIGRDFPAFGMTPACYRVPSNSSHLGRKTGMILEQHAELAWEEEPGVAPYHDASGTAGFGFHPAQQQQGRDGNSFAENDASMDMHGNGVADAYFG